MKLRTLALTAAALVAMSAAAPAYATSYGSESRPIRAKGDGDAAFYGNITVENHQYLRNGYYYRDTAAGGNDVYVQTDWSYWDECEDDGTQCWDPQGSDQSPRDNSGRWKHSTDYDRLDSNADKGRGTTKVCEDQHWSPDPCSTPVTITLPY